MAKKIVLLVVLGVFSILAVAEPSPCTTEITMQDTIGPASLDQLQRALRKTTELQCKSLMVLINTPGGSLQTTRMIVEEILSSPVPILCLVYPAGGHAGSAGAIILQACHVNGAIEATNLGAATPISSSGENIPDDARKKLINDTMSWMDGMTKLRGRDQKFARDIVEKATAVSAEEAKARGAIDFVVKKKMDFLQQAAGRKVKLSENQQTTVEIGDIKTIPTDLRTKILNLTTDPQFAYLLLMGSLALIYFELTHPGTVLPGIVGASGLIISLISLHKLNVEWGGLLLVVLGLILLIAEAMLPGFGALGISGVVAFFVGSLFLFDPSKTGFDLPLSLIIMTTLILGSIMMLLGYFAFKSRNVKRRNAFDELIGREAKVVAEGFIEVQGENWKFESADTLQIGDRVVIESYQGLTLKVKRK